MIGVVKWFDRKKGYGFIYGGESIETDGKENILPEYFVHLNQVKSQKISEFDMVSFDPHTDKKGLSAQDVRVIKYNSEHDPRCNIACKISDEFDFKIPCLSWTMISYEDMAEIYNYLKADRDKDVVEMKRISEKYEFDKIPQNEYIRCIASGGYYFWQYEKEQMTKEEFKED